MLRAIVIPPEGGILAISLPADDRLRLTCLQDLVGGFVEAIRLPHERMMLVNEEAKLKAHKVNNPATMLACSCGSIEQNDYIAGVAVVVHTTALN